jgi:hypothetical protein
MNNFKIGHGLLVMETEYQFNPHDDSQTLTTICKNSLK